MKNIQKLIYLSLGSLFTVIVAFLLGTAIASDNTSDMSGQDLPFFVSPTSVPTVPQQSGALAPSVQARPAVDLSGYNIAYLAGEGVSGAGGLFSGNSLFGQNARTFNAMADLAAFHQTEALDVLAIHGSARDQVDRGWIASAVRQGIVLVTINVPFSERAEWVNSECDRQRIARGENFNEVGNYAYVSKVSAAGETDADIAIAIDHLLNTSCMDSVSPEFALSGLSAMIFGRTSWSAVDLDAENGVQRLQRKIFEPLWEQEQQLDSHANRYSSTFVPGF